MAKVLSIIGVLAIAVVGQALTPSSFLTTIDQNRLKAVFEAASPYSDTQAAHYSILGLKLLGATIPNAQDACKDISKLLDGTNVASIYYGATAAEALGNCKIEVPEFKKTLTDAIKEDSSVQDITFAFLALKSLGLPADDNAVSKALLAALNTDDSPSSHGYAFLAASQLTGDISKFVDNIEDVVAQADEVDDKYLQFEGGLFATALVVDSAYKLAEKNNKAPTIAQDKVLKFANYFLSRRHVHQLKSAYYFLSAIKTLTTNKFHVPVAVTLASPVAVTQTEPSVRVQVTDLLGGNLGEMTVTADSARHLEDGAVVLSKKQFSPSSADKSIFELNFLEAKPAKGFYKLTISVAPKKADPRLIGTTGAEVEVKVTTKISIENVEIGVADKDQATAARTTRLVHPNKAASVIEADYHQKIVMKFQLKDKATGQLMTAHQAFVRLTNTETKQEIIFVTEADNTLTSKFDLDVGSSAKEFASVSGKYNMELIIGDAVIENPFSWLVADVSITFPESGDVPADSSSQYAKKPEIKHKFNEPEKRPPATVSIAFTALVLLPLLILLVLWIRIGVNISNFPLSLSAVGFHICLGAIFGLYYCYWTQLNMFQTLRWLGVIAVPTFFFGNRLLSALASKRLKLPAIISTHTIVVKPVNQSNKHKKKEGIAKHA
ncbi:dolichyl-diphosphooligosaccharide--protein glycosyltransferase subunit 2-like isoform X1 [Biomphalaria glabrata]|uniref:Dolichyl-diphosphooligosaccharide--protein glycosyltransferase subunit 2 n=1 Tax=Biomphalaria glabrata TaxID=6526 RepID=A0A9W2Z8Z0_BIOGL|nr:dolichyl-diphosphooligosaccharide--protein glycosyltransferase subunit 2-like isoform X1 [Biomphalaria glabrata]